MQKPFSLAKRCAQLISVINAGYDAEKSRKAIDDISKYHCHLCEIRHEYDIKVQPSGIAGSPDGCINIKLLKDDRVEVNSFMPGRPLYVRRCVRDGISLGTYIAAQSTGLLVIEPLHV